MLVNLVDFSSFIKYNVLGPIVTLFIFVSLYRSTLLKKASIGLAFFVLIIFMANYLIGFIISGSDVDPSFYIGHFWKYFAGSVIYDNYIFTTGIRVDTTFFYKILTFFFALPNMFFKIIFDEEYFPHIGQSMRDVSDFGEESNVVAVIAEVL